MTRTRMQKSGLRAHWLFAVLATGALTAQGCADAPDPEQLPGTEPAADPAANPADAVPDAVAADLAVSISGPAATVGSKDGVMVTVTLTNVSGRRVRVLERQTAVRGLKEDLFHIVRDGAAVAYLGRHYKWAEPQASDYLVLERGGSVSATVDLSTAYDFSMSGTYAVHMVPYGVERDEVSPQVVSSAVQVRAEGRPFVVPSTGGKVELSASLTTTGCSSTRISQLTTAYASARSMSSAALSYLTNTTPAATARYTTWFGTFSSTGWSTVKSHFTAITQQLANEVADCTCTDSAYAYVYPTQPYKIYLCGAFWPAPNVGTDSKAGTLIHEMSHFNVVAGTDDWAYGQTACKRLAKSNVTRARDNADSHEYFAENTPAQQ